MLITMKTEIITSLLSTNLADSLTDILRAVSETTLIKQTDIRGRSRDAATVNARFMYCWIARHQGPFTFKQIGDTLSRDHSTVINAVNAFQNRIDTERLTRTTTENAMTRLEKYTPPKQREVVANEVMVPLAVASVFAVSYIDFFFNTLHDEFKQQITVR